MSIPRFAALGKGWPVLSEYQAPLPPFTTRWTADRFVKFRAATARVRGGAGRGRFLWLGDSTTRGEVTLGSDGPGNANAAITAGPMVAAAEFARTTGLPVSTNSLFGTGGLSSDPNNIALFDPRISFTGTPAVGNSTFGGNSFLMNAAGQSWSFTTTAADVLELYWVQGGGLGTFNLYIDTVLIDGAPQTQAGATGIRKRIFTGLANTPHTIKIEWVSSTCIFNGWLGQQTSVPAIDFVNGGAAGSQVTTWANSNAQTHIGVMTAIGADACNLMWGINDPSGNADPSVQFSPGLTSLVGTVQTTLNADAIMMIDVWSIPSISQATQQAFRDAAAAVAATLSLPYYDLRAVLPDYNTANALGYMGNPQHPNKAGYQFWWTPIGDALAIVA